jgi:hypothetical protein
MEHLAPAASGPKFVRWAIVLAIVIVLNILFLVIRSIAFPAPVYEDYCPNVPGAVYADTQSICEAQGGSWVATAPDASGKAAGYCDFYSKCQKPWMDAEHAYQQKAFALMMGLAILALIAGILPIGSSIVSSGLSYGGVLALIIGSAMYWNEAGNWLRLAIAVIALAILVYIGLKRFRD